MEKIHFCSSTVKSKFGSTSRPLNSLWKQECANDRNVGVWKVILGKFIFNSKILTQGLHICKVSKNNKTE